MTVTEQIQESVRRLPLPLQAEVLDFAQYLLAKTKQDTDDAAWSSLSLNLAMRGMEDEDTPAYTFSDLKVVFT